MPRFKVSATWLLTLAWIFLLVDLVAGSKMDAL